MRNNDISNDRWAEWEKLVFVHTPAFIKAAGTLISKLILIAVGVVVLRFTLWPALTYTMSFVERMVSPVDGAKAAMFISLVIGFVAVFAGICICFCRYWDSR